jgi:hypothetical protein
LPGRSALQHAVAIFAARKYNRAQVQRQQGSVDHRVLRSEGVLRAKVSKMATSIIAIAAHGFIWRRFFGLCFGARIVSQAEPLQK